MSGTVVQEVDGLRCHCNPLPVYPTGGRLLAELADIAAPAIAVALPEIEGSKVDINSPESVAALLTKFDVAPLLTAVGQALGRLAGDNPARFTRVTGELLRGVTVELPVQTGDGATKLVMVTLASSQEISRVVGYSYGRLMKLLWFALGANFGATFAAASSASPPAVEAAEASFRTG